MKTTTTLYARPLTPSGRAAARPVAISLAAADVRAHAPHLWPFVWLGMVAAGQPVTTPTATYTLDWWPLAATLETMP